MDASYKAKSKRVIRIETHQRTAHSVHYPKAAQNVQLQTTTKKLDKKGSNFLSKRQEQNEKCMEGN